MFASLAGIVFDGFAYGMLLFLLSVGLSVTLGMMNFINLAHCSFGMLGGYVTVTLMDRAGWPFLAALPAAFVAAALFSVVLERLLFRRMYRASELDQCLMTIGVVFMSVAGAAYFWGTVQQPVVLPPWLTGAVDVLGVSLSAYRLFLIGMARLGAQVRAAVDNQRMARGLGVDVDRTFTLAFALGSGLAGLGGALAIGMLGLEPGFAFAYLIYVLIVVSVGGLATIWGSFAAAALLGLVDMAGKYYVPFLGSFMIYLVMVGLLVWRPAGLFGKR
jgi:branched-chain amino acid transport system permease protein